MIELSEEYLEEIRKDPDKQDWNLISYGAILSEDFIREFQDKIVWYHVSSRQNLSKEFIVEFIHKINFNRMLDNKYISNDVKDYCRMFI